MRAGVVVGDVGEIGSRASLTERARREICRRVGEELDTVAEVAREFGVGWACAHRP